MLEHYKDYIGDTVRAQYNILSLLGQGGHAAVFLAEQKHTNQRVALKIINRSSATDESLDQFKREARLASRLKHPNICEVFEYWFDAEQNPYIAMEFVEGKSIEKYILDDVKKLPVIQSLKVMYVVGKAMDYAHRYGVVHRDLKPSNVMAHVVDGDFEGIKILDFGCALTIEPEKAETGKPGLAVGSPAFMSPEQCTSGPIDFRSDIYSLGCSLFFMLTGKPVFQATNPAAIMKMHVQNRPNLDSQDIPEPVADVIAKCLEKKPDDRYQHVLDLTSDLKACGRELTQESPRITQEQITD